MPNPYAVEYGRFSSGLVVIQTRRGSDAWHVAAQQPRARRSAASATRISYNVIGIAGFAPQVRAGRPARQGPRVPRADGAVSLRSDDVPSRPEDERRTTNWFSSFTRVDANLTRKHSLIGTAGSFRASRRRRRSAPSRRPRPPWTCASASMLGAVTERALWSDALVSESTFRCAATGIGAAAGARADGAPARRRRSVTSSTAGSDADHVSAHSDGLRDGQGNRRCTCSRPDSTARQQTSTAPAKAVPFRHASDGTLARRLDFRRRRHRGMRDDRRRAVRAGPRPAELAFVHGVRRSAGSRRRHRSLERHAASRRGAALERVGQRGDPWRLRAVLRADAVGGRRLQVRAVQTLTDTRFAATA